jgi:hypothetical protein
MSKMRSRQMQVRITSTSRSLSGGTWYVGTVGRYHFEALVFAEPSQYGIDGGQVSKLCLLDGPRKQGGRELACYERGWELRPEDASQALGVDWHETHQAIDQVVAEVSRRERERYWTETKG